MVDKMMDYRASHPGAAIYDLYYERFAADPVGSIRETFSWFGDEHGAEAERRMRSRLAKSPADRFGTRSFGLADFGLAKSAIHDRFARYYETFSISRDD